MKWLCFQIGRREHYAVPRALLHAGEDVTLVTDYWASSRFIRGYGPSVLSDRFNAALSEKVYSFNASCLCHELTSGIQGGGILERALRRNRWWERQVSNYLVTNKPRPDVIFSYSYAANEALRYSLATGIPLVLGQIDGGWYEESYLKRIQSGGKQAPEIYWREWQYQIEHSSVVIVNSRWSAECLRQSGSKVKHIEVVPLAYEGKGRAVSRLVPHCFSEERKLRILFLGQIIRRKGVSPLLDAARILAASNTPVELRFVGPGDKDLIEQIQVLPNATYAGIAGVSESMGHFSWADVFILPTFSDGFAITQLEAQSMGLPIIASRNCGDVVHDGYNGLLLDAVNARSIEKAILQLVAAPELVEKLIRNSNIESKFSLREVGFRMASIAASLRSAL
jgi:glycosyltransferase involved in cell wall biosynthesis